MSNPQDDEMVIDTSKMNSGQREALEVAEAAREKEWAQKSFAGQLFMGRLDVSLLFPFPQQSQEDKKIGDEYVAKLSRYLKENLDPEEVDRTRTIPEKVIKDFFEMGVFAMKISKEYGGLGFSQVNYNRVMQMVASHCSSTTVLISAHQSIGVPQPLKMFGTEEQKKKILPRFRKDSISAFALTEPTVGSDPAQMMTEALPTPDGKFYILNGLKQWCTNGPIADILVVMAKTPPKIIRGKERKQITAFIVEKNTPGIEMLHRCEFMGLGAIQNGILKFTDVKVPAENILLGEGKGLKLALATLNTGRLTLPAACAGMAKQCLSIARRFGKSRVQWGAPVGLHEAGREKISFIAATTLAMEAVTWISSHFADKHNVDIRLEAAMAKLFCSEAAWKIVDMTMQLLGGRGYEKASSLKMRGEVPYPVERMMRDARINTIIEGTSEIMKLFLAREAMDSHLKLAGPLLNKNTSLGNKIKTLFSMLKFYSTWYPAQWLSFFDSSSFSEMGVLKNPLNYVKKTSHRLARTLFHCMVKYQDRLEKKQIVLGNLMCIGTELFAMAATVSYAKSLQEQDANDSPIQLAAIFCSQSKLRIKSHFRDLSKQDNAGNKLAEDVLNGKFKWLEKNIIWVGPED